MHLPQLGNQCDAQANAKCDDIAHTSICFLLRAHSLRDGDLRPGRNRSFEIERRSREVDVQRAELRGRDVWVWVIRRRARAVQNINPGRAHWTGRAEKFSIDNLRQWFSFLGGIQKIDWD